jgi:hypothetical protein
MKQIAIALLLALTAAASPSGALAAESRHSGQVVAVDPSAGTVRFQEMIAWTGPNTGIVERTVRLTPATEVQLVQRATTIDAAPWPNAWEEHRISLDALHPGDFVTVTTRGTDTAVALEVVRPEQ